MKNFINYTYTLLFFSLIIGCSSSKKFNDEDYNYITSSKFSSPDIKILLDENPRSKSLTLESTVILSSNGRNIAIINEGNSIKIGIDGDEISMKIGNKSFNSELFKIETKEKNTFLKYNGKRYRGAIKIIIDGKRPVVINELPLEDYLRGVLPLEMPLGKGNENVEALKAMAVAARTYSFRKMNKSKTFDVYLDVRDQVYGGVEAERALTNKIIDFTHGLVITYDDKPAQIFYSASCGGHTENSKNVFGNYDIPYLEGVVDGNDEPYCSIMPNFEWEEEYSEANFLSMLKNAGQITNTNYNIDEINIESRFKSGRVNELKINLESDDNDDKEIVLKGNRIRSIIRRSNGGILKSTMFDIEFDGDNIVFNGKGNGHGVGLCQWGSLYLSHEGTDYKEILSHYFPGTEIKPITYDK